MIQYPFGAKVRFRTSKLIVHHGDCVDEIIEWSGRVNGDVLAHGDARFVPVFCDRVGKGATTIFVSERNIIAPSTRNDRAWSRHATR